MEKAFNMKYKKKYSKNCDDLKELIEKTGEPLEGNCVYRHLSFDQWDVLANKRINYKKAVKGAKLICEIGFNAGHSVLAMILANPNAHYVLFDLGEHTYARPCFEYISNNFLNTKIEIFWGDSCETLVNYHKQHPEVLFDLVHIDGGHKSEVYSVDWKNSLDVTHTGSLIIFDDTDNVKINAFVDREIANDVVIEASGFLPTFGYRHRILKKR